MISIGEVQAEILRAITPLPPRAVPVDDAAGLAIASDLYADESIPQFDNAAVDGLALRSSDIAHATTAVPVRLIVAGELPAGGGDRSELGAGQAIRIMTGAPIPVGADAVVKFDAISSESPTEVFVGRSAHELENVHVAGCDITAGEMVMAGGTTLSPAHLGVLASLGFRKVGAFPRPRIGVLSTGTEVVEGGSALDFGEVRDANRPMLLALVDELGAEAFDLGIASDDERVLAKTFHDAIDACDVVITSGGISSGNYDLVPGALEKAGAAVQTFQVGIRPAKPFAFGLSGTVPIFSLPGNPVSSMVSFELFARPAILQLMGYPKRFRPEVVAIAEETMARHPDGRVHLDRVRLRYDGGRFVCSRSGAQQSNVLSGLAQANGLAILSDGDGVRAGEEVKVMRLDCPPDH